MSAASPLSSKSGNKNNWHRKIASNRGSSWHKNMLLGRREAVLNPSNIRLARLKKNIHQAEIAKRLDMSESTFGAIERGKRPVKSAVAKEIANQLGMPLEKVFRSITRVNPRKPEKTKYLAVIQKSVI
jgi:DNA-binding XRE family transcriptional regulator